MSEKIAFIMPSRSPMGPMGGYKVVYEYANHLVKKGYRVDIIYPLLRASDNSSFKRQLRVIPRFFKWILFGYSGRRWFSLDPKVKERIVWSLKWPFIPKSDYYIATEVSTSYHVKAFPITDEKKLYLIQDYEIWLASEDYVNNSYKLGLKNIAISSWLRDKIKRTGAEVNIIKNGFDFDYFKLYTAIEDRNPFSIAMLYHVDERKGCKYGIEAFIKLHDLYPNLKVTLFGGYERPNNLPEWIEYYQKPDKDLHNKIYNESAIYLAPSIQEGWGLTVGEAMICGAAIVCTDALGFKEMVTDKETALICKTADTEDLIRKISFLLENNDARIQMAKRGNLHIQDFTWNDSVDKLEKLLQ